MRSSQSLHGGTTIGSDTGGMAMPDATANSADLQLRTEHNVTQQSRAEVYTPAQHQHQVVEGDERDHWQPRLAMSYISFMWSIGG